MSTTDEVNVSDLSRHTVETFELLAGSRHKSLRVRRRDAEDVVLTTASRAEQDAEVVHSAAALLAAILRNPVIRSQHALDMMRDAFPWVRFLPVDDLEEFVTELSEVLSAADSLDNSAPAAMTIHAWKSTAEAYADPEVAEILQRDATGDFGPVSEPSDEQTPPKPTRTRRAR